MSPRFVFPVWHASSSNAVSIVVSSAASEPTAVWAPLTSALWRMNYKTYSVENQPQTLSLCTLNANIKKILGCLVSIILSTRPGAFTLKVTLQKWMFLISGLKDIRNVFTTFWVVFPAKVHDFWEISYTLKLSLYLFFPSPSKSRRYK